MTAALVIAALVLGVYSTGATYAAWRLYDRLRAEPTPEMLRAVNADIDGEVQAQLHALLGPAQEKLLADRHALEHQHVEAVATMRRELEAERRRFEAELTVVNRENGERRAYLGRPDGATVTVDELLRKFQGSPSWRSPDVVVEVDGKPRRILTVHAEAGGPSLAIGRGAAAYASGQPGNVIYGYHSGLVSQMHVHTITLTLAPETAA